ncbi:hypothetical protein J2T58_002078 [Methanocalculus alkaliphilus]|nr:hypothetical protein [Methanocalculus alkaliphilus]
MVARMALFNQPVLVQRRDISPDASPIHNLICQRVRDRPMAAMHSERYVGKVTGQTGGKVVNWMDFYQGNKKESPLADPEIPVKRRDTLLLRPIVPGHTLTQNSSGMSLMDHNGFIEHLQAKEIHLKVLYSDQLINLQKLDKYRHEGMMQADAPIRHSPVLNNTNRLQERAADPKKCENKEKGVVPGVKNRNSGAFVTNISRCSAEEGRSKTWSSSIWLTCIADAGFTHYRRGEKENGVNGRSAEDHEEVE